MDMEHLVAQLAQQSEQLHQLSDQLSIEHHARLELSQQLQQQHALSITDCP